MIYTVTFNPSLDYIFTVDEFKMGNTNRTTSEEIFVGGKGINVSIVLNNLGYKSTALGFIGGFTGEEIKRRIEQKGISTDFIKVHDGFSRINLKLISHDGTEINGNGARISKEDLDKLFIRIENIKNGDLLILAGSVPKSIDQKIYSQILDKVSSKNILVSVDATNQLLLNTLKYEPFLIKPNKQELEQIFDTKIEKEDEIISYAKKLKNMGAKNVIVSLGKEGAILICEDNCIYKAKALDGEVINSVGAGDSMVAGFLVGYLEKQDYLHAFKMGLSAGCGSAFLKNFVDKDQLYGLYDKVHVE